MTDFGSVDEVLADERGIDFTARGRPYTIRPPTALVGLWCERLASAAGMVSAAKTDGELADAMRRVGEIPDLPGDLTMPQRVLGQLWQQLADDGIDHVTVRHIALTAFAWAVADKDAASRYWSSGGHPERLAPNRASRRSPSTGAESTTPGRGSTSGTNSPRTRRRHGRGRRSGGTGS